MRNELRPKSGPWRLPAVVLMTAITTAILLSESCKRSSPPGKPTPSPQAKSAPAAKESPSQKKEAPTAASGVKEPTEAAPLDPAATGKELFAQHCAACHGERGDGKGLAAAFLFPKPRDLRNGRFRLVSTNNNVPTREDMHALLLRGMPGSAMPPWAHLSQQERDALVDEVMQIRSDGIRETYIQQLKDEEDLTDEDITADDVQQEIQEYVDELTAPGQSTEVPTIGTPTAESIARGKEAYVRYACVSCHGETGRGDGVQEMVDDDKMPTRPRDFTLGIFKGNHDEASLYRRIAYGMPGTPMPGSSTMSPEQMMDLVHYIRSLSSEELREAAIPKREKIVAKRVEAIPDSAQADSWAQIAPVHLKMTPLWWRNDADPDLTVQAIHDGKTIAVRLTWKDETTNQSAVRTEEFEDGVALELFPGKPEPFLGMGDPKSPVDVWFWDADRQTGLAANEQVYPNTTVDVFPFSEGVVESAELNRTGARLADQPDVSLPARASGNLIVPPGDDSGGSSLQVAGPRTVTFRIPQSQLVRAHGEWHDGRWTVVMTRALTVPSGDDGVSLPAGDAASVAFAVWDGSHKDRDGQKSITIWQDLELEK